MPIDFPINSIYLSHIFNRLKYFSGAEIGTYSAIFLLTQMGEFDTLASSLSYP